MMMVLAQAIVVDVVDDWLGDGHPHPSQATIDRLARRSQPIHPPEQRHVWQW
jgi:hypothetical protein